MSQKLKSLQEFSTLTVSQTILTINPAGNALTLSKAQSGEIITLNSTSGSVITLGAPQAGLSYTFLVNVTGGHTITAPSASIYGSVTSTTDTSGNAMLTTGAAKSIISTTAGSAVGDQIQLLSDGTNYFVKGSVANFNALKFT
jgi:hypothetical protein